MISAETLHNKLSAMKLHYIHEKSDIFMADMSRSLQLTQNSTTGTETGEEKYLFLLFSGELCLLRSWRYTVIELTKTKTFMDWMVASTKHYWFSVKLLSVVLTSLLLLGNTMKCLQPCVTHVSKDTTTSSSIFKTNLFPVCVWCFPHPPPYSQQ